MMKRLFFSCVIFLACLACQQAKPPVRQGPLPERIISLKPNITEILFDLGLGEKVVGVTTFCKNPPEVDKLPKVADYTRANLEQIFSLKPDLVITSMENSHRKEILALASHGTNVMVLPFYSLDDIQESVRKIGRQTGTLPAAEAVIEEMERHLKTLREKYRGQKSPKVLVVVGRKPLIVAGPKTFFDEALKTVHAKNAVQASQVRYPNYSTEMLLAEAPDVIIEMTMGSEAVTPEKRKNYLELYQAFPSLPAVKNNRIYFVDIESLPPSPRLTIGIEALGKILYENTP